ncbi:MAG: PQQ-binding-like beta-propeller repeat protein [Phyllobacteriaceae bacterium]|nr:PQQ-binding-like beta-propeller repeat protein [Phyllobacteriaceae bacterium]
MPLLAGEALYFGDGHEIVAVEARTGKERWRHAGVPDTLASYAPAISGDTVLAGPGDGRLYALSAADGEVLWRQDRSGEWQYLRQLHVHEGILVAGSYKEKLFGVAIADGRALWEFNAGNFINSHHVADGSAYLWSPTGFVYAIDATSGKVRWRHETTDYDSGAGNWASLMAELVVADGKLVALDMANIMHVLAVDDGAELARASVGEPIRHAVLPLPGAGFVFPSMRGELLLSDPP